MSFFYVRSLFSTTKPGMVMGNMFSVLAGFVIGQDINLVLLLHVVIVSWLVMSTGCVFNNYIDRDIDALMSRTKNRAIVTGAVLPYEALIFAFTLLVLWMVYTLVFMSIKILIISSVGLICYVVFYTILTKRKTIISLYVGAISGAIPPLIGYCASRDFNLVAIEVFLLLFFWQIPHFIAISIFRADDYKNASIPTIVSQKGLQYSKIIALTYNTAFVLVNFMIFFTTSTGYFFLLSITVIGVYWMFVGFKGLAIEKEQSHDNQAWAKKYFGMSIVNIMFVPLALILDYVVQKISF